MTGVRGATAARWLAGAAALAAVLALPRVLGDYAVHVLVEILLVAYLGGAWNLAGGYQKDAQGGIEPVLAIHRRTMQACAYRSLRKGARARSWKRTMP
jgi:hypothetical protein